MRNGSRAGSAPWQRSTHRWPSESMAMARRSRLRAGTSPWLADALRSQPPRRAAASARWQAERAEPVLLAELERDRVAELDQLGLGKVRVQALPQGGVGHVAVPG